ncbi:MAG: YggS family pyridoxal phosphate-dependent enzyme [Lentisphaeria bacterium]|jgi:hypothetical protein
MPGFEHIPANLAAVRERIAAAARRAGRAPESVRLLAVGKTFPAEAIAAAHAAGQRLFGENRVQELREKAPRLPADCEWHLIGQLQANKCRPALQHAAWIHSVASAELITRLERIAGEEGRRPVILLEINLSGEASKSGATAAEAPALVAAALRSPHLDLRGFMTLAPFAAPEAVLQAVFGGLRELRDRLAAEFATPLPELSMGMSGDFEAAIACGATLVRIGTAVFGQR